MNLSETTNNTSLSNATQNTPLALEVYYWEQILTSILIGLVSITGIIGNSMIILAVLFSKKLWTSTNVFVSSLGVADLLTSFFLIFYIIGALGKNRWPIPDAYWLCSLTGFITYVCTGVSLYTLGAIAVNRLILIVNPRLYHRVFTPWKVAMMVVFTWLIPIAAGTGAKGIETGISYGYSASAFACGVVSILENRNIYSLYVTLVGFPIPFLMITISYIWIYVHLKKHFKQRRRSIHLSSSMHNIVVSSNSQLDSHTHHSPSHDLERQKISQASRQEIEITKNLFLVVCSFFLCFLPFFILNAPIKHALHGLFYTRVLTLGNSAINFFIYARRHSQFKHVLGLMIRCSYSEIPQPSRFLKKFFDL